MNRVFVVLALLAGLSDPAVAQPEGRRPNILFILADDLGARDLSNEGSTFYESPNIDRIAKMGMKFTQGYAACQVCSPSRASILTGKYPVNHGITTWIGEASGEKWRKTGRHDSHFPAEYDHQLRASEQTLAEVLRDNGYKTFFAGKWHLGGKGSWPEDHGFSINKGGFDAGSPAGGRFFAPYTNPNLSEGPPGESLPVRLGQETADFIEANQSKPFLAYLSFYSVHAPIQTTPSLWKKYRDKAVNAGLVNVRFRFDRRLSVRQVQDCPIYAGMIEAMDEAVGIVLAKLEELQLLDNTIVCFTSDNGGVSSGDAFSTSNAELRGGKGRQWEGGIREPFYLAVPGMTKAGSLCDTPVNGVDWYPTLLELAGVKVPDSQTVDGVSLVPLLRGKKIKERSLFWHYPHYGNQGGEPSSIILDSPWKLIYYHEDSRYELYNIDSDRGEQHDVIAEHSKIANELKTKLQQWLKATQAKFPEADPQFNAMAREARWSQLRTTGQQRLEAQHAHYLDDEFKPNQDWWGSAVND